MPITNMKIKEEIDKLKKEVKRLDDEQMYWKQAHLKLQEQHLSHLENYHKS